MIVSFQNGMGGAFFTKGRILAIPNFQIVGDGIFLVNRAGVFASTETPQYICSDAAALDALIPMLHAEMASMPIVWQRDSVRFSITEDSVIASAYGFESGADLTPFLAAPYYGEVFGNDKYSLQLVPSILIQLPIGTGVYGEILYRPLCYVAQADLDRFSYYRQLLRAERLQLSTPPAPSVSFTGFSHNSVAIEHGAIAPDIVADSFNVTLYDGPILVKSYTGGLNTPAVIGGLIPNGIYEAKAFYKNGNLKGVETILNVHTSEYESAPSIAAGPTNTRFGEVSIELASVPEWAGGIFMEIFKDGIQYGPTHNGAVSLAILPPGNYTAKGYIALIETDAPYYIAQCETSFISEALPPVNLAYTPNGDGTATLSWESPYTESTGVLYNIYFAGQPYMITESLNIAVSEGVYEIGAIYSMGGVSYYSPIIPFA